jgi:hypothetical protein
MVARTENCLKFELNSVSRMKRTCKFAFEEQNNILQADFSRAA